MTSTTDLVQSSCLFEGGFAKVYDGWYKQKPVVIKRGKGKSIDVQMIKAEAEILRKLSGAEGVVQIVEVDSGAECLVLEKMDGDLLGAMKDKRLTKEEVDWVGKEVLTGLDRVAGLGYTHGDLKPSNILLRFDPASRVTRVKIADFGSATTGCRVPSTQSRGYRSPEALIGAKTNGNPWEFDVWCLGVVLYQCMAGSNPFDCGDLSALCKMCEIGMPPFPKTFPGVDPEYSETFHNLSLNTTHTDILSSQLITALLALTPSSRPSPASLLSSGMFATTQPMAIMQDTTPPRQRGLLPIVASPPPELPEYNRRM
eukprot:TRINITY_DN24528_c0_g1_i1.p1 TRINITY_DN24528_c0_g1~~TRINITY_DN24528_c0_g1_i1.p1  ORF type:complete len:333 (+),score=53.47 TRINITY_DN24528_c0_g1_i1:61-999(+)